MGMTPWPAYFLFGKKESKQRKTVAVLCTGDEGGGRMTALWWDNLMGSFLEKKVSKKTVAVLRTGDKGGGRMTALWWDNLMGSFLGKKKVSKKNRCRALHGFIDI